MVNCMDLVHLLEQYSVYFSIRQLCSLMVQAMEILSGYVKLLRHAFEVKVTKIPQKSGLCSARQNTELYYMNKIHE